MFGTNMNPTKMILTTAESEVDNYKPSSSNE